MLQLKAFFHGSQLEQGAEQCREVIEDFIFDWSTYSIRLQKQLKYFCQVSLAEHQIFNTEC